MAATSKLRSCNRTASCRRTTLDSCIGVTFQMTHQTFAGCWRAFLQARCLSWNPTKNGERTADTHTQTSAMQDKCFNAGVKFLQLTVEGFQLQCALLKPLTTAITANSIFIFISYKICRIKSPVNPATEQRSSLIVSNQHNHWQTRLSSNIVTIINSFLIMVFSRNLNILMGPCIKTTCHTLNGTITHSICQFVTFVLC